MPDTRPGIKFNKAGVCYPCLAAEKKKSINWNRRFRELKKFLMKFRRDDDYYDCVIAGSGGKDTYYQVYVMKELMGMNPLVIKVKDSYTETKAGAHNLKNMCDVFGVDLITYNLNHDTMRRMTRIAFEEFGLPNWAVDLAIYSVPLRLAYDLGIKLVVYGENISYEYGGPHAEETHSAKNQIKNNAVKEIDWEWWEDRGVFADEVSMIQYPCEEVLNWIEPIYLSFFMPWDGRKNYELAKKYGFKDCTDEWDREGFIENYDQIDSIGYVIHPQLKYQKYGHARATDVASYWIRNGYITRNEGMKLVEENDHIMDSKAIEDFLQFTGYTREEFDEIVKKHTKYENK